MKGNMSIKNYIIYMYGRACVKFCLLLLSILSCLPLQAQEITTLDWEELRIDSLLPVYTEVIPLETDYRRFKYSVSVEYPEWGPLTAEEIRRIEEIGKPIADTLQISSAVSISRKRGMLDIAFMPIVKQGKNYRKLLSAIITVTPIPKAHYVRRNAAAGERYVRQSVLAQGRWVKISIPADGMYRLTRAALKKMGFSNPDNVHLYGYGGYRLNEVLEPDNEYDDLQEVPLYKADSNTWLFWGNGLMYWEGNTRVFNPYSTRACYFLTETDAPSAISTVSSEAVPVATYSSFTDHVLYEKDEYAWFSTGRNLYENVDYGASNSHSYKLSTQNSLGNESLTIAFTAGASSQTHLTPVVNGNTLSNMTLSALGRYSYATQSVRTTDVSQDASGRDWAIRLTSTAGNPARLDYLALHYSRSITPASGYVAFSVSDARPVSYKISSAGPVVMRIGEPGAPACIMQGTQNGTEYEVTVDDGSRRYVAFEPDYEFPQPTVVGEIENQNLHGLDSIDMVIIVPASDKLTSQAERLAEAHRTYDGLRVEVVRADRIYNEFSSGTPDATAYRRLMKMLYDRAGNDDVAPRYLLLFGDCAWDNRMLSTAWRNYNPDDYLLCFESENSFSDTQSYVLEDYFGLLDDGEGARHTTDKVDLGVGRFPVTNAKEAKIMVDKTISFLTNGNAGTWKNQVWMLGDDGDNNGHLKMADNVAEEVMQRNPELEVRKVMWDAYTRVSTLTSNTYPEVKKLIQDQMDKGALVMNYTGHGSTYTLSHEFVLKLEDFKAFRSENMPLWVTAACDIMPFDGLAENIGEAAVLNENGAAVAFLGTARTVYMDQNFHLNRWFMNYLFATDSQGRRYSVGDALRLAKCQLVDENVEGGQKQNKLQYALLGDPALVFGAPLNRVVLDSINGVEVAASDQPIQLQAGQKVRLSGHIENAQHASLSDFSGIVMARLFDSFETIVCKNNANVSNGPFEFRSREKVLFSGQDSVRAGEFTFNFVMPIDINYSNESGRLVFYAINDSLDTEANGYSESFTVGGVSSSSDDDSEGPQLYAYLNTEDFENGGRVNSTPYFVAQLSDESGINYSGSGLGHDLLLTIDGDASQTYILNDYYTGEFGDFTRGVVGYSIPQLEEGRHSLTFRAWDLLNNSSSTTLDFVVDGDLKPVMLNLTASQNPALVSTNFIVSYNFPGTDCDLLIEVFDFAGRRMWAKSLVANTNTGQCSVPWNLTMSGGGRLFSGVYFYRATLSSGGSKKVSKTQKIVIHGNK